MFRFALTSLTQSLATFGNRLMRAVAAQHRDTIVLDDGTNVNIVDIPTQRN